MKLVQAADSLSDSESTTSSSSKFSSTKTTTSPSSSQSKARRNLQFPVIDDQTLLEDDPVFKSLKGYSLFNKDAKLQAIVNFLKLSSLAVVFTLNNPNIDARVENLVDAPKLILKCLKKDQKFPSAWSSKWCAEFLLKVVNLIKEDAKVVSLKISEDKTRKSAPKKKDVTSLPVPATKLVEMVKQARLKVEHDRMSTSTGGRKRKTKQRKSVQDYLLNRLSHESEFREVTKNDIVEHLLCPLCNHRLLMCLNKKEEVEKNNKHIRIEYEAKLAEWNTKGRVGSKPRMTKTESQVLGCACYTQNCIGNVDGTGCFVCKDAETGSDQ